MRMPALCGLLFASPVVPMGTWVCPDNDEVIGRVEAVYGVRTKKQIAGLEARDILPMMMTPHVEREESDGRCEEEEDGHDVGTTVETERSVYIAEEPAARRCPILVRRRPGDIGWSDALGFRFARKCIDHRCELRLRDTRCTRVFEYLSADGFAQLARLGEPYLRQHEQAKRCRDKGREEPRGAQLHITALSTRG